MIAEAFPFDAAWPFELPHPRQVFDAVLPYCLDADWHGRRAVSIAASYVLWCECLLRRECCTVLDGIMGPAGAGFLLVVGIDVEHGAFDADMWVRVSRGWHFVPVRREQRAKSLRLFLEQNPDAIKRR